MVKIKHYGDITKIDGHKVEIPSVITGGSPCQDLSVAGKREGLAGERSGLFMEQIRVIKELREHDANSNGHLGMDVMPRYSVWENVAGALSSNNGEDFRVVLEETARIAQEGVSIPGLEGKDKWSNAGAICGDGWSIAWRLHDSQWWGVPQRRKRLCVLADFNGYTAADLLFECFREACEPDSDQAIRSVGDESGSQVSSFSEGLRGDLEKGGSKREESAESVGEGVERPGGKKFEALSIGNGQLHQMSMNTVCNTLDTMHDKQAVLVADSTDMVSYGIDRASFNQGKNAKYDFFVQEEISQPLVARGPNGVFTRQ